MTFARFAEQIGLRLEPFQKRIEKAAAGPEREFVALLPRGQGKTTLLAAIALHHLITVEDAAVYCAASSREQARILFEAASAFARVLEHPNVVDRHLELRFCPNRGVPRVFTRFMRVLAANAPRLHGLQPTLMIVDELHAHATDEVYIALSTALIKHPGSKLLTISTAGQGADSPLGKLRSRALGQPNVSRRGVVTDARGAHLRFLEWSVPEDGDVDDPRVVKKANPASWITLEGLAAQREAVPDLAYRRFHANQWTERAGHWLPAGAWNECIGEPEFTAGEDVWIGVDIGGERSATAVVWINERLHVGVSIYHGDEGVIDAVERVRELAEEFTIRELSFDPWRFQQGAQELEQRGIPAVSFPQTDVRMIPASDRLYRAIVERRLTLPDSEELRQHAANAIARHSRRGWRIDRAHRSDNVDGIIALCMALEAMENQPEPVEVIGWL